MDLNLSAFHFLHPAWFWVLPPLLLLCGWGLTRARRQGAWGAVVDPELLPLLQVGPEAPGRQVAQSPWGLLAILWTLAVLALAGPAWRQEQAQAFRVPASWVIVLDLAPSMSSTDVSPDRVTRARYAIADLLSAAHDAHVGLVAYAGEPHVVTPLTSDIATVRLLLQPLSPAIMPESGNRLAPALDEAAGLLGQAHGDAQIILLADNPGDVEEARVAARRLHAQGITLNVVGVGTEAGAPAREGTGGFVRDSQGGLTMARMQSSVLREIATQGGGIYVPLPQLSSLSQALQQREAMGRKASAESGKHVGHWRNEGVWLLPPLLLLTALLARRGWV